MKKEALEGKEKENEGDNRDKRKVRMKTQEKK